MLGIVACGHPQTAAAAAEVLREGGNAFDAIVAAHFATCVSEPVLASLGGGGYLMAHAHQQQPQVYDFFNQTPRQKRVSSEVDFYPVTVDFGGACQEFHIGLGAVATPGSVRGMFQVHRDLCSLPMPRLLQPAIRLARQGVVFNQFQAYIFKLVAPIYTATPAARAIYSSACPDEPGASGADDFINETLVREGQRLKQPEMADTLEELGREGDALFYEGELAESLVKMCRDQGGHLIREDLSNYQVIRRQPLMLSYRHARVYTNPPPSSGGILMAFALGLLNETNIAELEWHSETHLRLLALVMELTNKARVEAHCDQRSDGLEQLLDAELLQNYRQHILQRSACFRGTTHISVMDNKGNSAALTVSNGEGCGCLLPGSGIMLNNVLGEEDINPGGFHCWQPNQRMTSMMAPSLIETPEGWTALGSGGSNRIRTALLQVISNLVDFNMTPEEAVDRPRVHLENNHLDIEGSEPASGASEETVTLENKSAQDIGLAELASDYPHYKLWQQRNLFFGGVHLVQGAKGVFNGAGDPRRGGVVKYVEGS